MTNPTPLFLMLRFTVKLWFCPLIIEKGMKSMSIQYGCQLLQSLSYQCLFLETQYGSTHESSAITKGCIVVAGSHVSLASSHQNQYPEATGIDLTWPLVSTESKLPDFETSSVMFEPAKPVYYCHDVQFPVWLLLQLFLSPCAISIVTPHITWILCSHILLCSLSHKELTRGAVGGACLELLPQNHRQQPRTDDQNETTV